MKIACYQMQIIWEEKEKNYEKLEQRLIEFQNQEIDLLLLPEMSFTGFSMHTEVTKEAHKETIGKMRELAVKYNIALGFGWVKDCGQLSENHYSIVDREGNVLSDYAKIHPFSYSGEDQYFRGGETISICELAGMKISTFICYDLRFPEIFQTVSKEADMIIVPANWPQKRSAHWKCLLKARAIENQVYIAAINCVGEMDGQYYSGDSCIINPNGEVLQIISDREGIIDQKIVNDVAEYRKSFPIKQDRREALYANLKNKS